MLSLSPFSRRVLALPALLGLAWPAWSDPAPPPPAQALQARLLQHRLVVAHRGRTDAGQSENSPRQMQRTVAGHVTGLEVDLASNQDGVLYLLHDTALERTTTGKGQLWPQGSDALDALRLKDGAGNATDEALPRLEPLLDWVAQTPAVVLLLDIKHIPAAQVAPLLRARNLQDRVILLTFDPTAAADALAHADGALVSVLVNTPKDIAAYRGLAGERPLAMYVPRTAKPALIAQAHAAHAVVISDVLHGARGDVPALAAAAAKQGCQAAYAGYLASHPVDVLVSNVPLCALQALAPAAPAD